MNKNIIIKKFESFSNDTIEINNAEYDKYLNSKKTDYGKVAWDTQANQIKNYKLIAKNINNGDSVLDFGCGLGDLIDYLTKNNINISNYMGVDINNNYIELAKNKHPNYDFNLIKDVHDISGNWDIVCAIGVFTWYIKKDEFIDTIKKLYSLSNKKLLITVLDANFAQTPYNKKNYTIEEEDRFWSQKYRWYNSTLFYKLFPELSHKMTFEYAKNTILVKISK
jgi:cyclopropane fatty-acyl-phospholipid synthase-like methyltransferase